jgi:hypothetical protein
VKKTTIRTFKYDDEGRILEETVTEIEESYTAPVPSYPYPYVWWYPYPKPYVTWTTSSGSLTSGGDHYKTYNTFDPPKD